MLTPRWRQDTVFVVDDQDAKEFAALPEYKGIDFWVRPDSVKGIAKKRAWILENILEDKIVMMDDDLSFEVRDADNPDSKTRAASPEDLEYWLEELSTKLDSYAHAGLSVRRHNDKLPAGWFENSRMQCILGYRPEIMRRHCELGRIEFREDFDYTLQLLKKGFPNTICSEILFSQKYNAPGGISTYRTLEYNNEQALMLEQLHPGIVKAVQRKYKGKDEMAQRIEVICYWKKAYEEGLEKFGRQSV
jgi:hypothetical protein